LSAFFSFATVVLSCLKPGKIAASVSPIEALRYTETTPGKFTRKSGKAISISRMAAANLAGSKGKTVVTVISLSLSVVLFTLTITFAGSFSVDK
jgi:putative ABC transport system permease protein